MPMTSKNCFGAFGMVNTYNSKESKLLIRVRALEQRWKGLVRDLQHGLITIEEYQLFELPFTQSLLEGLGKLPEIGTTARTFVGTSFFIKRSGLPTMVISIDDSGIFRAEPENASNPTMPEIEFADTNLYIEGILWLSSRERFLKAYVGGAIKVHELHRFRKWAPYVLALLLKIDRDIYQRIVCSAAESIDQVQCRNEHSFTAASRSRHPTG